MMEESSDEQPEMVSREEAEEAEKEASAASPVPGSRSGSATPTKAGSPPPGGVPAPSPLPSFLTSPSTQSSPAVTTVTPTIPPAQVLTQSQAPKMPSTPSTTSSPASVSVIPTRVSPPQPSQTTTAPGPLQTPVEASSATPIPPDSPPLPPQQGAGESGAAGGLFGWFSHSHLVSRVMEKTKSSVEHVITTLDPGMREVIFSGGDMDVVVTSMKENKVGAIREAFQQVFGRATVTGQESQTKTAAQPVGFTAGLKGAEERIQSLRQNSGVEDGQAIVSVEGFIVEMLPDRWYEMSCLVLQDPKNRIELQTFSQPTLIPTEYVLAAQDRTPSDYPLRWAGLAATIGQVIEEKQPHIGRSDWQGALSGVTRRETLFVAAKSLAFMYKQRLPPASAT